VTEGKDIQILIDERELHGGRTEGPLRFEPSDNAAEHCRGHDPHNRWIELNSADQCRDEGHTACRDRDPSGQDEFAATLDLGGEASISTSSRSISFRGSPSFMMAMLENDKLP
jgi:hypothetical protein